jgi:hypothetical protein
MERMKAYTGNSLTPLWALGMGFVLGKEIVSYIAESRTDQIHDNLDDHMFKTHLSADMQIGFWLAPLKDVFYVHAHGFHDYPRKFSLFAKGCSEESVLVHRINHEIWLNEFDAKNCLIDCPAKVPSD